MGQGAPAPSERKHHHRARRQQARSSYRVAGQARHHHRRCRAIRPRGRSALLRDLGQDKRERPRALHRHRKEAAARPSRAPKPAPRPAKTGCKPQAGGEPDTGSCRLQLLVGGAGCLLCRYSARYATFPIRSDTMRLLFPRISLSDVHL